MSRALCDPGKVGRGGLAAAGLVLGLIFAEVGLRFIGGVFHDNFTTADPQRGWALRPGFSGWMADENTLWVRINSDGLRDREHSLAVPPDTVRVAVLGDSYMQGLNVPLEKTFPSFLQGSLARCLGRIGRKAETVNFGVSGYGTAQELLTFRYHVTKYNPAVVLMAFYTNNDVYNNSRALNPSSDPEQSPYFVFDHDQLVLDASFRTVLEATPPPSRRRRVQEFATNHSRMAQLLYQVWSNDVRPYVVAGSPSAKVEETNGRDLENEIYRPPTVPETKEAWRVTEALLLAFSQEVRAQGAEPWIVTLSNTPQVNPDPAERKRFREQVGVDSLFYPDFRIRDFAVKHGIPVITLAPALADYSGAHKVYLNGGYNTRSPFGTGHWNEVGNRVAAKMVGDQLCSGSQAMSALPRRPPEVVP
jgi:hypothetical protein